jgi:hypothetical protein
MYSYVSAGFEPPIPAFEQDHKRLRQCGHWSQQLILLVINSRRMIWAAVVARIKKINEYKILNKKKIQETTPYGYPAVN